MKDRLRFRIYFKHKTSGNIEVKEFNLEDELKNECNNIPFFTSVIWIDYEIIAIFQCTGSKDSKEKLIFEGDITEFDFCKEVRKFEVITEKLTGTVIYLEEYACYSVKTEIGEFPLNVPGLKIIGNIHQNPELLEAK